MKFFLFLLLFVVALFLGSSVIGIILIGFMSWFAASYLVTSKALANMSASRF